jgi:hypothetical protein
MKLIEQIDDLIKQATTERSHHYVASTLLLCRDRIAELEEVKQCPDCGAVMGAFKGSEAP